MTTKKAATPLYDSPGDIYISPLLVPFSSELERDFRVFNLRCNLAQVRTASIAALFFSLIIPLLDYLQDGMGFSDPSIAIHALVAPLLAAMIAVSFVPERQIFLPALGMILAIIIGFGSILSNGLLVYLGNEPNLPSYALVVFYIYFFLGLRFWQALAVGSGVCAIAATLIAIDSSLTLPRASETIINLLIANCMAAIVLFRVEFNRRMAFVSNNELGKLVKRDSLTGLANRRTFDEEFERAWTHCEREKISLSLVLIDVDHFKAYNDSNGHQMGDHCLVQLAEIFEKQCKRSLDLAARYGGEEFVLLLPDCSSANAAVLAENLRLSICNLKIPHRNSPTAPVVTISGGIGTVVPHQAVRTPAALLQCADKALYEAKSGGRNCIKIAGQEGIDQMKTGTFNFLDTSSLKGLDNLSGK